MGRHSHWRDCQAWRDEGLEMSTTSNEAVKLFDASLTQENPQGIPIMTSSRKPREVRLFTCTHRHMLDFPNFKMVGRYEDSSVGGFMKGMSDMMAADETFVMGHVLKNMLRVMSFDNVMVAQDPEALSNLNMLYSLAQSPLVNPREMMWVEAVKYFAVNKPQDGLNKLEDILLDYPTDMLAIKFGEFGYFGIGDLTQQRDSKYRVFPHWKPSMPLYSYLYGMIAYGETETGLFEKAEKNARRGTELNPLDGWSVHALAHVLDHTGRYDEGIQYLNSTVKDWSMDETLACHNQWHLGLYHIEKGDMDAALHHFDQNLKQYEGSMFQETDKATILYRLEMEGVDIGDRWSAVFEKLRPHLNDSHLGIHDMHCVMACLGAGYRKDAQDRLNAMQEQIKTAPKKAGYWRVAEKVGIHLCEALMAFDNKDYAQAVECLVPVRYDTRLIAGSNAQRDVIAQLLIHSAILSPDKKHQKLARNLINERRAHKHTPMVDRLMGKLLSHHDD